MLDIHSPPGFWGDIFYVKSRKKEVNQINIFTQPITDIHKGILRAVPHIIPFMKL